MNEHLALVIWLVIFWPVWSPTMNMIRWQHKHHRPVPATSSSRQTGPKWEQDKPFPECFDKIAEDDL